MTTSGSVRLLSHHDRRRTRHVSMERSGLARADASPMVTCTPAIRRLRREPTGLARTREPYPERDKTATPGVRHGVVVSGAESVSAIKVVLLMGLLGCVIGLKLAH
jgi:hypothetical protein